MNLKSTLRGLRNRLPRNTFFCVLSGIATYVPGLYNAFFEACTAEATRYCYAIWLRHLVFAHSQGFDTNPSVIAELGPGNSLGPGLAGLLCGANRLYCLDVVNNLDTKRNLSILDQLVELLKKQERIPDENEFPGMLPVLDCYDFPSQILTPKRLTANLRSERLEDIRAALKAEDSTGDIEIKYYCPWYDSTMIQRESCDLVYSQYVLEHVDDLEKIYSALALWIKHGGYSSHVIDFSSHNLTEHWNGHWRFGDFTWKLICGKKPYLLNRYPCSKHLELLAKNGFEVVAVSRKTEVSGLMREDLAKKFRTISESDLLTRRVHIVASKCAVD